MKKKLLILHGALGSQEQFDILESKLTDEFEVYKFNFTGHGGGDIPPQSFSIDVFSKDLIEFLKKQNFQDINIFGYSMGGYVALYTVINSNSLINNCIKKIFTLGTKFNWNPETSRKEASMLNPEDIESKIPKFSETLKKRHTEENWKSVLNKTAEMMINLGNNPEIKTEDLSKINIPVLITVGDKDNMVTIDESSTVAGKINGLEFKVLENTFHPIEKVDIEMLSNEIKNFIN